MMDLCGFYSLCDVYDTDIRCAIVDFAVRPVVTLKSDINLVEDTTGEADYTF